MRHWLGLLLSPSIALAAQSVMFALVTPACGAQTRLALHLAAAVALGLVLVLGAFAIEESSVGRRGTASPDSDGTQPPVPRRFLADIAAAVSALSALVILAMWFALWMLSPCTP